MAALPAFRVSVLEDLAAQLRYGGRAAILRIIARAESMAATIDPDALYTQARLVRMLTGYRPDAEDEAAVPGAAVLVDLSTLVEHLCEAAHFSDADTPPGSLGVEDLMARWSVSRRTIERRRRMGLIARRVHRPRGGSTLWFTPAAVEAFEARIGAEAIDRAAALTRLSEAEIARATRWARGYARRLGWSLSRSASRIAVRLGRSHEGVRGLLIRLDREARAAGSSGLFPPPRARGGAAMIRAVRLAALGVPPSRLSVAIAHNLPDSAPPLPPAPLPPSTPSPAPAPSPAPSPAPAPAALVHAGRVALVRRVLRGHDIDHDHARQSGPAGADAPVPPQPDPAELERSAPPAGPLNPTALALYRGRRPGPPDREARHALAMRQLLVMASSTAAVWGPPGRVGAAELDALETLLRRANRLRTAMLEDQLGVAVGVMESTLAAPVESWPVHLAHAAIPAMIATAGAAIDRWTPGRGGRLAAVVNLAVSRVAPAFTGLMRQGQPGRAVRLIPAARSGSAAAWPNLWRSAPSLSWAVWLLPAEPLLRYAGATIDPSQDAWVLARRLGLDGLPPASLDELVAQTGRSRVALAAADRRARLSATRDRPQAPANRPE